MNFSRFFAKKPIKLIQKECADCELVRSLSATNLVTLGIGCIIGTGIFVMTGQAAAQYAGPAIIISFLLAGLCCAFAAMCYAELASMLPVSGSAYSYAYASLGELAAWVMGWLLLLEYGIAGSTVAVGWSGYVVSFLKDMHILVPPEWTAATGMHLVQTADGTWQELTEGLTTELAKRGIAAASLPAVTALFNMPAFLGLVFVTMLLVLGVKESATVNNVIVFIKVVVILLFIGFGVAYINPANWHPFIPENTGTYGEFGWSGIIHGAGYVFFAYVGFEAVSTAAQEAKNPQRDMPIGIIGSLAICTVLYILVSLVLTGIVKYTTLGGPAPIAMAVDAIGMGWLATVVKIGAIAGLSSVMLVLMYGQTRIFFTMARDGLLPEVFSTVHPKFRTPWINTILVGIVSAVVAGMTPIEALGDLVNLGTLMAFTIICFTVLYLRIKEPKMKRPFKIPFPKLTPILGMAFCGLLMSSLGQTFINLIPYFVLGFAIYFGYSAKKSKINKLNQRVIK